MKNINLNFTEYYKVIILIKIVIIVFKFSKVKPKLSIQFKATSFCKLNNDYCNF